MERVEKSSGGVNSRQSVSIDNLHLPHPPVHAMINLQEMIWRISSSGRCIMIAEAASKL
jgi:hypothetical protein